jgi:TolB-like protein
MLVSDGPGAVIDSFKLLFLMGKNGHAVGGAVSGSRSEVFEIVDRLEARGALGAGSRLSAMLRYIITEEQGGRGDRLKAFAIAQDVLGRGDDFDPQTNSIVRVEMARLRRALDLYFATAGKDEPVAIRIPKGGYRPVFEPRQPDLAPPPAEPDTTAEIIDAASSPIQAPRATSRRFALAGVVALSLLLGLAGGVLWTSTRSKTGGTMAEGPPAANSIGIMAFAAPSASASEGKALARELAAKLALSKALLVVDLADPAVPSLGAQPGDRTVRVQHVLTGELSESRGASQVSITLTNAENRQLVWSRSYANSGGGDPRDVSRVANLILNDLRPQIYSSAKQVIQQRTGTKSSPVELFLVSTWFPGFAENSLSWEQERVSLARRALGSDPKFGPAHSVLADKLSYLANVDAGSDTEAAGREAQEHASLAVALAPGDPAVLFNVALHYWHTGQMDNAARAMKRVVELDPANMLADFMAEAMPFTCAAAPSETMQRLLRIDESFGTDNPVRWVTLGWIARLRLNDGDLVAALDVARRANQIFEAPDTFLLAAAILVQQDNKAEAAKLIAKQRTQWPNLNLRHYAESVVPRRCAGGDRSGDLKKLYLRLAEETN